MGNWPQQAKRPLKCSDDGGVCAHVVMYIASRVHVSPGSAEALVR